MAVPEVRAKRDMKDWQTSAPSWWCPGCGDFGVLAAMQRALANIGLQNEEVAVVSGIGCSGKITGYINSYSYHSLHGRATPPAQAIKIANKDLTVIVAGGDGDGYGIGAGHFVHAVRRNVDLTYIVMDNNIYGLTKGQVSPTSSLGFVTSTTPEGNTDAPVNPLALFLAAGGTFLAQGFSGDMKGLTAMIEAAVKHKGFSLINVFSPCVTFNKKNTYAWYRDVLVDINTGAEIPHDPRNKQLAMQRALDGRVYSGILYQEERPEFTTTHKTLQGPSLASLKIEDKSQWNYAAALENFR